MALNMGAEVHPKSLLARFRETVNASPNLTSLAFFCGGALSGAVSRSAVAPLERIKVIFQVQESTLSTGIAKHQYSGVWNSLIAIPREQGIAAFWRGNATNIARTVSAAALKFTMYERFQGAFMPKGIKNYSGVDLYSRKLISGGLSGACMLTMIYPLDVARTWLIADTSAAGQTLYNGPVQIMYSVAREQELIAPGIQRLYQGWLVSIMGIIPGMAISFTTYDAIKSLFSKENNQTPFQRLLAGSSAGIISQTIMYPVDTLRKRMQICGFGSQGRKAQIRVVLKEMLASPKGYKVFYGGFWVNFVKAGIGAALQYSSYDYFKRAVLGKN